MPWRAKQDIKDMDRLQIVYVLVSSEDDIYLEQAFVSMRSAKMCMPEARVVLVVDSLTAESLTGVRKKEAAEADDIVVVETPREDSARKRSRILKTSVREHVKGDYVFIDTDTIVVKPLYDILDTRGDIAACHDTHWADFRDSQFYDLNVGYGRLLGWPIEKEEHFFNSGVLLVRDTDTAHKFYAAWSDIFMEGWGRGIIMDQPAFAKANYILGHVVTPLDDTWNCQLKYGVRYLRDARIVHYLFSSKSRNRERQLFILNDTRVLLRIKETGELTDGVRAAIGDPFGGLAPVSHSFAGDDLYFFWTPTYRLMRKLYGTRVFKLIDGTLSAMSGARAALRRMTGGRAGR